MSPLHHPTNPFVPSEVEGFGRAKPRPLRQLRSQLRSDGSLDFARDERGGGAVTDLFQSWGLTHDWAWGLATLAGILLIAVPLLLGVAMIIYADRKIWAAMALRRGPNVVGPWGLLQSFADGLKVFLQETIVPQRREQGHLPDRADCHFRCRLDELGGGAVQFGRGAGGYQCRAALYPRDQLARGLRRGHGRVGLELEIPVFQRDARRRADDFLRSLDRLHPDLRGAVGGHRSTSRPSSRASAATCSACSTATCSTRCCSRCG